MEDEAVDLTTPGKLSQVRYFFTYWFLPHIFLPSPRYIGPFLLDISGIQQPPLWGFSVAPANIIVSISSLVANIRSLVIRRDQVYDSRTSVIL